jgi:DNA-binding MarR family transcriptional regulator/GNAT superfamily N-acetyltransferase
MSDEQVAVLRGFNRTVTQRIGALEDQYLARHRSLGASRVLWEIGPAGTDVRSLRTGLDLDSGYLSRLLRSLEDEGLVQVTPAAADGRVREVRLTKAGVTERERLDQLSDELARSLLAPLSTGQRDRLVEAVATVERLLTSGLVEIRVEHPSSPDARYCVSSYFAELDSRFDDGFDPVLSIPADDEDLTEPVGLFLVARLRDEPVGCGALKLQAGQEAEIKRMWVEETARGLGLGRSILSELERQAVRRGAKVARLETNKALTEAISLYRTSGYVEVESFNDEPYAHHWFKKELLSPSHPNGHD